MKNIFFPILKTGILFFLFLFLSASASAFARPGEYTLKAVFIERFTRFVEWPPESEINNTSKPFKLGIIGSSPLGSTLKKVFSTEKIRNKKVNIRDISNLDNVADCHLLFISKCTKKELFKILAFTKNKPILTVSDSESFAKKGVFINFYIENKKIRFEINETAVRKSGLSISYLLLRAAKIVNPPDR